MFVKTCSAVLLLLFCCSLPLMAQSRSARGVLLREASNADLEALLHTISQPGEALNHLALRGEQAAGAEVHARFVQVLSDERVRRVYALLQEMPRGRAAALVRESFNEDFRFFTTGKSNFGTTYGLHAKLWLTHQFDSRENYRKQLNKWDDWVHQKLREEYFLEWYQLKEAPYSRKRDAFTRIYSPELLMRLNLELIDQLQGGSLDKSPEFVQLLKDAGMDGFPTSFRPVPVLPFDAEPGDDVEPLAYVPAVLGRWYGLDGLAQNQRVVLADRVRNLVDPKGLGTELFEELGDRLLFLARGHMLDLQRNRLLQGPRNGVRLKFLGSESNLKRLLARAWNAGFPPTKQQFIDTLDRLGDKTPAGERAEWQELIDDVHDWLSKIPEEGLIEERRKVIYWPADVPEGEEGSTLRIRVIIKNTKAFAGELKSTGPGQFHKSRSRTR